jgi:predicted P-loop ATPase/GTPase
MRVLVAGADRVDAGKTTFSTGLIERLDAVGYKPRAGNDYWFDHNDYRRAIGGGRLYGKDAERLAAASAADVAPEEINPVHRLWRPSPGPDNGLLGQAHREFVLDRAGEGYVVNAGADVPASAVESLPLAEARTVATIGEVNEAMRALHLPAFQRLRERIARADPAVVESYGDVARPLRDLDADAVAVVEPGRARIYRGGRYLRACEAVGGTAGDAVGELEERTEAVLPHLTPTATADLPALGSAARADPKAVATAYGDAYDAVEAAAERDRA